LNVDVFDAFFNLLLCLLLCHGVLQCPSVCAPDCAHGYDGDYATDAY
jgi:hypothetical protein